MNVYDFDNTIYKGESALDFYFFILRKNPVMLKYIPLVLITTVRYKLCLVSLEGLLAKLSKYARKFLSEIDDIDREVKEFWDKNGKKIKKFYLEQKKPDDVIISAGCDFLLEEILKRLGIKNYLCTEIDIKTGEVISFCYNKNKVELFNKKFPGEKIDNFYTDSLNDLPMIKSAENAYLIKYKIIKKIK